MNQKEPGIHQPRPTDRPTEPPPRPTNHPEPTRGTEAQTPAREDTRASQTQPTSPPPSTQHRPPPTHTTPRKTPPQNAHPNRRSNPPTILGRSTILHPRGATASRWRYGGIHCIPQPIVGATGGWVPLDAEDQTPWRWPMFTGYRGAADVPTPLA